VSLVELGRFPTRVEADLARLALGSHGVEALLFDSETNNFFGGGGLVAVRLMVDEDDLGEARRLLSEGL
jgi:hypothetical protein